jgi:alkyl sulfatase BDS1-like metallo-beta-lactamase superfamily hydrolase
VWYDYNPSHLHPSRIGEIAAQVVSLAGGAGAILSRARDLRDTDPQLALHLVDFVVDGAEDEVRSPAMALKAEEEHCNGQRWQNPDRTPPHGQSWRG